MIRRPPMILSALVLTSILHAGAQSSRIEYPRGIDSVKTILRPRGWTLVPEPTRCGCAAPRGPYTMFRLSGKSNVQITLHRPPFAASIDNQFLFEEVIARPPHILDAVEKRHMLSVTGSRGDVSEMKTVELNGKRVLMVDQTSTGEEPHRERTYYIDARGTGERLEQISYEAPPEEFSHYLEIFNQVLESLVWNSRGSAASR